MSREEIASRLAEKLRKAAPSNQPESTKGIPGGLPDWDKFAKAIVEAMDEVAKESDGE